MRKHRINTRLQGLKAAAVLGASDYACTNGKNPSQLSNKQYLEEFAKGPCTPALVLAGIAGTRLNIEIECEPLKASHPDLFAACGWSSCSGFTNNVFGSSPKPEYSIWIPEITAPFSLVRGTENSRKCFAGLFGMDWKKEGDNLKLKSIRGVSVKAMGASKGSSTLASSRCGFDAISNITPLSNLITPEKFKQYEALRVSLEAKGYRIGLTLQALPYDWRKSIYENDVSEKFEFMIEKMYSLTGKKVSIIAHSFGNINTLHNLKKMTSERKKTMIQRYFALAPPYLGAPNTWMMLIAGTDKYYFAGFGINFWEFKQTTAQYPGLFDLMPRPAWSMFKDTPWLKSIMNRVNSEKRIPPVHTLSDSEDIVKKILPSLSAECHSVNWATRPQSCFTGMDEYYTVGSVAGKTFTVDNFKDSFQQFSYNAAASFIYSMDKNRVEYDALSNPEVETVIIYGTLNPTAREYHFESDPSSIASQEKATFILPDKTVQGVGDSSVLVASSLIPGFKWAYEFENKQENSKPVVFAEVCGTYSKKSTAIPMSKNEYYGIGCSCTANGEKGCNHLGLVSDSEVVKFLTNSLIDNQTAVSKKLFDSFTDAQIDDFVKNCKLLNP